MATEPSDVNIDQLIQQDKHERQSHRKKHDEVILFSSRSHAPSKSTNSRKSGIAQYSNSLLRRNAGNARTDLAATEKSAATISSSRETGCRALDIRS